MGDRTGQALTNDPIDRIREFLAEQKRRRQKVEGALVAFSQKILILEPRAQAVVAAFRQGLRSEPGGHPTVTVFALTDPLSPTIAIDFGLRAWGSHGLIRALGQGQGQGAKVAVEKGATAVFACSEEDGFVVGFRWPFTKEGEPRSVEEFINLGDPAAVAAERFGHAVVDFLEWAAVGEGRGSRKFLFND